ncbi:MAG: metallopeptidase [Eubacterium sp.]|nr:metallopeptidase [Eubacterium sp.]
MAHIQTQSEWEQDMCIKILDLVHSELYLDFRYLETALSALSPEPDLTIRFLATDGIRLFYSPDQTLKLYRSNQKFMNRAYMHSILHCIFRQLWIRGKRKPAIWNLASDIAVEWVIDSLKKPSVSRILSMTRIRYYDHLEKEGIPVSAAAIYQDLLTITDPEEQMQLQLEFYVDDHRYWPGDADKSSSAGQAADSWEKIGRKTQQELALKGLEDSDGVSAMETQIEKSRNRRSYRDFLRKFTVLREEMHIDEDEFDLNYYTYGLRLYKNMPLIEPLESREITKIAEFVIVIDTSFSTNGDLVKRFLTETFTIISQRDSFFRESHIRIIQCDNQVHSDQVVRNEVDMQRLLDSFTLIGGGGTDFRPAFAYVDNLLEAGTFKNLKGLLYFTDGKGTFPKRRPSYDTAFIFMGRNSAPQVPPWAMKLELDEL